MRTAYLVILQLTLLMLVSAGTHTELESSSRLLRKSQGRELGGYKKGCKNRTNGCYYEGYVDESESWTDEQWKQYFIQQDMIE